MNESTLHDKLDTILRLVGPAPLFGAVVLGSTEVGPLLPGSYGETPLFLPTRDPRFELRLAIEVVDQISFRYRFKEAGRGDLPPSVPRFAQLYRVRGAD